MWREIVALGAELRALDALVSSTVRAEVAILLDWENWWALELEGKPSNDLRLLPQIRALYVALFQRNITVDFAHPAADLSAYKLVIAPHLYLVSESSIQNIHRYVAGGGVLLMTFFSGIVDSNDHIRLGGYPAPFRELLGIGVEEFAPYGEIQANAITTRDGHRFGCQLWSDILQLQGAEAIADYTGDYYAGTPAVTRHAYGRGVSYYAGAALGADGLAWLLSLLCAEAGIHAPQDLPAGVEMIRRTDGEQSWLFYLNHSEQEVKVRLDQPGRELLTGAQLAGSLRLGPAGVAVIQS